MNKISLWGKCPICNERQEVSVSEKGYVEYLNGTPIQKALSDASTFEREFIISGLCFKCQSKTFGHPAPGDEESYGKLLGHCECCGYPLYSRKIECDGKKICPWCKEPVEV